MAPNLNNGVAPLDPIQEFETTGHANTELDATTRLIPNILLGCRLWKTPRPPIHSAHTVQRQPPSPVQLLFQKCAFSLTHTHGLSGTVGLALDRCTLVAYTHI